MTTRLRRVDAVRLRLMPPAHVAVLEQIGSLRNQSMSKVLRMLTRRFDGDVSAYWTATFRGRPTPRVHVCDRIVTSAELQALLKQQP